MQLGDVASLLVVEAEHGHVQAVLGQLVYACNEHIARLKQLWHQSTAHSQQLTKTTFSAIL